MSIACEVCGAEKPASALLAVHFQTLSLLGEVYFGPGPKVEIRTPRFEICNVCAAAIRKQRTDGVTDLREIAKGLVLAAFQDAVA